MLWREGLCNWRPAVAESSEVICQVIVLFNCGLKASKIVINVITLFKNAGTLLFQAVCLSFQPNCSIESCAGAFTTFPVYIYLAWQMCDMLKPELILCSLLLFYGFIFAFLIL